MFVDSVSIIVKAGAGGPGKVSFRREKYIPKGGPNGGDGGDGASVVFEADSGLNTLYDFRGRTTWEAKSGDPGLAKQAAGRDAEDLIIRLPPGTMIHDEATGDLLHDLKPGERLVIAKGGRGGRGNEHFKHSTNQTPRTAEPGTPGEEKHLRLELKLIADVGLVGKPNAGKSTMLAAMTRANPKIAAYPFTTLSPQLGICEVDATRRLVIADIPGLIEGAAQGAGLGLDFLRHIERTRVLVHLLDVLPPDGETPAGNYRAIRAELAAHSDKLADKPELVVLNKLDLIPDQAERDRAVKGLCRELNLDPRRDLIVTSGATGLNLRDLADRLWRMVNEKPGTTTWGTGEAVAWKSAPWKPAPGPKMPTASGPQPSAPEAPAASKPAASKPTASKPAKVPSKTVAAKKNVGTKVGKPVVKKAAKTAAKQTAKKVLRKAASKPAKKPVNTKKSARRSKR
jgi:GTP-binding protein